MSSGWVGLYDPDTGSRSLLRDRTRFPPDATKPDVLARMELTLAEADAHLAEWQAECEDSAGYVTWDGLGDDAANSALHDLAPAPGVFP